MSAAATPTHKRVEIRKYEQVRLRVFAVVLLAPVMLLTIVDVLNKMSGLPLKD